MRILIPALLLLAGCAASPPPAAPTATPEAVTPAATVPLTAAPEATAERVSVRFNRTPLPEALETLSAKVGWNFVLEPGVTTRVDLVLRDVPWRLALDMVLERTKCKAQPRGERTLYVHEPPRVTFNTH